MVEISTVKMKYQIDNQYSKWISNIFFDLFIYTVLPTSKYYIMIVCYSL